MLNEIKINPNSAVTFCGFAEGAVIDVETMINYPNISLGNKAKCKATKPDPMPCTQEEGKTQMSYANTVNVADNSVVTQREYLERRLSNIYFKLDDKLTKQFNLYAPRKPTSFNTLLAAIKADEYMTNDKLLAAQAEALAKGETWFSFTDENGAWDEYDAREVFLGVTFTSLPKPDRDGHALAKKALEAKRTEVLDQIKIADPKDALTALQAFETWTYTAPTA